MSKPVMEVDEFGDKQWRVNGALHREDGPAIEFTDKHIGHKEWYLYGKLHREDGPAVMYDDGRVYWLLNGVSLTEDQHAIFVHKQMFLVPTWEVR